MNLHSDPAEKEAANAAGNLARVNAQVDAMRSVLGRLLRDIAVAEGRLGSSEVSQLLEANEQLVVSAMRAQTDAETVSQALDAAHKSVGLDALTGLPNRLLMMDRLAGAIAHARRHGTRLGVLFVDLDRFKEINDTLGHAVGDEALKFVARCLESAVRAADTVSRHGGDEFVVLLHEVSHGPDAALVADKMLKLLGVPTRIGGHLLRLSASIGISVYPEDGEDAKTLIECADAAMYRAKRRGAGRAVFHEDRFDDAPDVPAAPSPRSQPLVPDHTSRNAALRESNEHLILAALGAQELQDATLGRQHIAQLEHVRLEAVVAQRTAQLVKLTHHIETAREDERARLARDLHDEMGAWLTSAKLDAARIKSRLADIGPEVLERLAHLVEMLNGASALQRNIIENLRPSTLRTVGLPVTLEILASDFAKRSGIEVHCALAPVRLDEDAELVLYRVVQEAITNISKYAQASRMWLKLSAANGQVELTVRDNGVGFDATAPTMSAYGLVGMRFRVQAEGGTLWVSSTPEQGTLIRVRLPETAPQAASAS